MSVHSVHSSILVHYYVQMSPFYFPNNFLRLYSISIFLASKYLNEFATEG